MIFSSRTFWVIKPYQVEAPKTMDLELDCEQSLSAEGNLLLPLLPLVPFSARPTLPLTAGKRRDCSQSNLELAPSVRTRN